MVCFSMCVHVRAGVLACLYTYLLPVALTSRAQIFEPHEGIGSSSCLILVGVTWARERKLSQRKPQSVTQGKVYHHHDSLRNYNPVEPCAQPIRFTVQSQWVRRALNNEEPSTEEADIVGTQRRSGHRDDREICRPAGRPARSGRPARICERPRSVCKPSLSIIYSPSRRHENLRN